ncbi:ATP-binding cassette domain-containing protein [Klebsiella pneumoniae]
MLATTDLWFRYQDEPVLKGLTLDFSRHAVTGLVGANGCGKSTLFMNLSGDLRPPQAAVTRDAALQTQWRRIMALRIPGEENPGARIDTQSFSPIAIPLSGAKLIAWRPQGSGGEMELTLSWSTVPALFSWLARCGMNPRSFSLGREAQTLRLRLLLEAEDER